MMADLSHLMPSAPIDSLGSLPTNWAALTSLQSLDASNNQFGSGLPGIDMSEKFENCVR